jgi:hypothetical protein
MGAVSIGCLPGGKEHVGIVLFRGLRCPLAPGGKAVDEKSLCLVCAAGGTAASGKRNQGHNSCGSCAKGQELSPGQNKTGGLVWLHLKKTFRLERKNRQREVSPFPAGSTTVIRQANSGVGPGFGVQEHECPAIHSDTNPLRAGVYRNE